MKNQEPRFAPLLHKAWVVCVAGALFLPAIVSAMVSNDPAPAQWGYTDTKVYDAWDTTTGSRGVVVAVIDNGFDLFHPDLAENVWKNIKEIPDNGLDDDGNGYVDDVWGWNFAEEDRNGDGLIDESEKLGNNDPRPSVFYADGTQKEKLIISHGTVVAGIIGAVGNNLQDGTGINWKVRLMNVKVIDNTGTGEFTHLSRAIHYAVDNGAQIINMSMVGSVEPSVKEAVKYAYDHGVAVVAAAGNDMMSLDDNPRYPVCADAGETEQWILGVSAVSESHRIAGFSNVGSTCVDITAPGINVAGTMRFAPVYGLNETYGGGWNGTSFAAPFVSGAAALIKSIHPSWQAKEIYTALLSTTHKTPPKDEKEYAMLFGSGLLQIDKAVAYAKERVVQGEVALAEPVAGEAVVSMDNSGAAISSFLTRARGGVIEQVFGASAPAFAAGQVQSMASGVWNEKIYAILRPSVKGKTPVEIRSAAGEVLYKWDIAPGGAYEAHLRDIMYDSAPELIVAPRTGGKTVYTVYSLEGVMLAKATTAHAHVGVSLAFDGKDTVYALYKDASGMAVHEFHDAVDSAHSFHVDKLSTKGFVARADVTGDGVPEFVITGGSGEKPYVLVYSAGGVLVSEKLVYANSYRNGVLVALGDATGDGVVDIITVPAVGGLPRRVLNGTLEVLQEKKMAKDTKGYVLVPVY